MNEQPDAWRDEQDGRIYINGRKYDDDPLFAYDPDRHATALWYYDEATLARLKDKARADVLSEVACFLERMASGGTAYNAAARDVRWFRDSSFAKEVGA